MSDASQRPCCELASDMMVASLLLLPSRLVVEIKPATCVLDGTLGAGPVAATTSAPAWRMIDAVIGGGALR